MAAITKGRTSRRVADRIGIGEPAAEAYIRAKLKDLEDGNYHTTVEMAWDDSVIADVYGLQDEHGGWYIKLYVEHGRVVVCSFHEPEHDLICRDGTVLKGLYDA